MSTWLLINPTTASYAPSFPMGLAYVSAALKSVGQEVHCLDMAILGRDSFEARLRQLFLRTHIDVVGVGGFSTEFRNSKFAIDLCRSIRKDVTIVIGGVMFSGAPTLVMKMTGADYGVLGEGEETVMALAAALDGRGEIPAIAGLYYRKTNGELASTGHRMPKVPIDDLPSPDYDGFGLEDYLHRFEMADCFSEPGGRRLRSLPVLFSRSCQFGCTFCFHSIRKYRTRSLDKAFAEIETLIPRYEINTLGILDDLIAADEHRLRDVAKWVKKHDLEWSCQFRVDCVTPEVIQVLKDSGNFTSIGYGFESISQRILTSMNKHITPQQIEDACRITYDAQVFTNGNFIFGDASENADTVNETINWWLKNRKYGLNLFPINIFPGTKLLDTAEKRGIKIDREKMITDGMAVFNVTLLHDREYNLLIDIIMTLQATIRLPGGIRSLREDPAFGNGVMRGTVRCPHCGEVYDVPKVSPGNPRIICKICNSPFDLPRVLFLGRRATAAAGNDAMMRAGEAYDAGDLDRADAFCDEALAISRTDHDAFAMKGTIALKKGRHAQAKALLREALAICPDLAWAQNNFGVALYGLGYTGWASIHLEQAYLLDRCREGQANQREALASLGTGNIPVLPTDVVQPQDTDTLAVMDPVIAPDGRAVAEWLPLRANVISPLIRSDIH